METATRYLGSAKSPLERKENDVNETGYALFCDENAVRTIDIGVCLDSSHQKVQRLSTKPIGGSAASPLNDSTCGGYESPSPTQRRPRGSLCQAALRIFLLNERGCPAASRWLETIKPLSLVSVRTCELCRETIPFDVRVGDDAPRSLWVPSTRGAATGRPVTGARERNALAAATSQTSLTTTRVAPLKVVKLTSDLSHPAELLSALARAGAYLWLREVTFGERTSGLSVRGITTWPRQVRTMTFECSFSHPAADVAFAVGTERLELGGGFNQNLVGVSWPARLKAVTFGKAFDQPIGRVEWPASLEELRFGHAFNRTICGIGEWAAGLRELTFGWKFDQSFEGVVLPKNLEVLTIGGVYNRPLDRVRLPEGLKVLTLGGHFDMPLDSTVLPRCLESLSLGWAFNRPLIRVQWPAGLKRVSLGYRFNQPANCVKFPPRLESLELGVFSRQSLEGLAWPLSLRQLTVGRAFDLTAASLPQGACVCRRGHPTCKMQRGGMS